MNNDPAESLCVCAHTRGAHDESGCIICAANGQRCDQFWSRDEYDAAVQSALVNIVVAERERAKAKRGRA